MQTRLLVNHTGTSGLPAKEPMQGVCLLCKLHGTSLNQVLLA